MFPSRQLSHQSSQFGCSMNQLFFIAITFVSLLPGTRSGSIPVVKRNWQADFLQSSRRAGPAKRGPPAEWEGRIPLVVTNMCDATIWPGVATQAGTGPGTGGFELEPGKNKTLWVGSDWQGRVWGRTNCTVNGNSCACKTGDCFSKLDCVFSGAPPATLAEFNLAGGVSGMQTFYEISLVDGYNIPMGINSIPAKNTTYIPPNLTNCACIATSGWLYAKAPTGTSYANSSFPVPLEANETNKSVSSWCPWPNLAFPPTKPGDGIYPYPDDNVQRPPFSPCKSACAATNSDKDCCVGKYHDPNICKPSLYSKSVKAVCPDAYSFAFDDQKSTFIIPKGGGWEVVMCPAGRSTNILRQLGKELFELASGGRLSELSMKRLRNVTYIEEDRGAASGVRPLSTAVTALAVSLVAASFML
ncbi:Pathogenesis-related protein 5 [Tolypocladium ophioglossoides CBS 100239]|uniref:Pathogenesis-related protein 5 n=1 Tax=Tolypocladium ophioglossoides (strain CBS 100239) TaxID=1163406 RepID=A0A0L0N6X1_TOLOC|nr:Pathogenesis-related protein 5 [Tolypocladium ophioglossoides CBS 100239]